MSKVNPPFRADHVGSLLRPPALLAARQKFFNDELPQEELRYIEDEHIAEAVKKQESVGLRAITDGEFRRTFFHLDFLEQLEGVTVTGAIAASSDAAEKVNFTPPKLSVTGQLRHTKNIQVDDFNFLQSQVHQTPKVTIPSPTMVHFRGGRAAIDIDFYPNMDQFFGPMLPR